MLVKVRCETAGVKSGSGSPDRRDWHGLRGAHFLAERLQRFMQ